VLVPAPVKAVVPPSCMTLGVTDLTTAWAFEPQSEKVMASVDVVESTIGVGAAETRTAPRAIIVDFIIVE
jgi:hypothetical protein